MGDLALCCRPVLYSMRKPFLPHQPSLSHSQHFWVKNRHRRTDCSIAAGSSIRLGFHWEMESSGETSFLLEDRSLRRVVKLARNPLMCPFLVTGFSQSPTQPVIIHGGSSVQSCNLSCEGGSYLVLYTFSHLPYPPS